MRGRAASSGGRSQRRAWAPNAWRARCQRWSKGRCRADEPHLGQELHGQLELATAWRRLRHATHAMQSASRLLRPALSAGARTARQGLALRRPQRAARRLGVSTWRCCRPWLSRAKLVREGSICSNRYQAWRFHRTRCDALREGLLHARRQALLQGANAASCGPCNCRGRHGHKRRRHGLRPLLCLLLQRHRRRRRQSLPRPYWLLRWHR